MHVSRWYAVALLMLLAGIWLVRQPTHAMPLERDEGAYAVIARDWLSGEVPYRDRFDHKPPLVYLAYMPALLGEPGPIAIRTWASLWLLATLIAIAWCAYRLWGDRTVAVAAVALAGVWQSSLFVQGITFNSESIMMLPACLALGCACGPLENRRPRSWFAVGIWTALAVAAKPVGALFLPALLIAAHRLHGHSGPWRSIGAFLGGNGLILAIGLLYFGVLGALESAYMALVEYNLRYAATSGSQANLAALWPIWRPLLPLVMMAGLGGLAGRRLWSERHSLLLLWSGALLIGALISLRPYPHYYVSVVAPLALWAAGLLIPALTGGWKIAAGLALATGLVAPLQSLAPYWSLAPHQQIERLYGNDGRNYFAAAAPLAAWINANVPPTEPIWIWAAEPEIYYLAERSVPTRYPYDYPLAIVPGARDEALADLAAAPPAIIVTYFGVRPEGFGGVQSAYGYRLRAHIAGFDIWARP